MTGGGPGFLGRVEPSDAVQRLYDDDVAQMGFVMNASRLWAHQPSLHHGLFELVGQATRAASLTVRQRGILVAACASTIRDSYCALAWGTKLAGEAGPDVAAAVIRGDDTGLDSAERALAGWARRVAREPGAATADDLDALRAAGYDDAQILAITAYVALRLAFSTVNGALGAQPDHDFARVAPVPVRDAVSFGRPLDEADAS